MNRRDLLKFFAAIMATLPFFGKAKAPQHVTFPELSGSWGTVEIGYIAIGGEMIEITPGGGWTPIGDVYGPTITIKYNDDMSHY